jgi:N4-gp56 family major capsid protein
MAETQVPSNAQVQQWDNDYFVDYVNRNWFKKFEGTGSNSLIQVKEDLTTKPGGTITIHLVNKLTGTAKDHTETLEGQEEDLTLRTQDLVIREYSHAVRWPKFQEQLTAINLRDAHKEALMTWNQELDRDNVIAALGSVNGVAYASASEAQKDAWVVDNSDRVLFGAATSNYSTDHSAALANIDNTADKISPAIVKLAKRLAKSANPKVRPFKPKSAIGDSDMYILFVGSRGFRDIENNSEFQQANREARERGTDNPLFTSADYIYGNVMIYEIEDIPVYTGVGAGSIDVAPAYLVGAQALGKVWAMRPTTVDDEFDYKRKHGLAIKQWYKVEKLNFGSGSTDQADLKQHGVVTIYHAAVAD